MNQQKKTKIPVDKPAIPTGVRDNYGGMSASHISQVLDPFVELAHTQNRLLKHAYGSRKSRKRRYYESSDSESDDEIDDSVPVKKSAVKQKPASNPYGVDGPLERPQSPRTTPASSSKDPPNAPSASDRHMYSYMKSLGF